MAGKRVSKKVVTGVTEDQFNDAMMQYAMDEAEGRKLEAQMDKEIAKVRERFNGRLSALGDRMVDALLTIEAYCVENKDVLFVAKRSMETGHGVVGFRLDPPEIKLLPKFTWKKVVDKLKVLLPDYVRTKEEADKARLLTDRATDVVAPHLAELGIYIAQDEQFYLKLKSEAEEN